MPFKVVCDSYPTMAPTKTEQIESLARALVRRQDELRANEEMIEKAKLRSSSLEQAIRDLRATIAQLVGEGDAPQEVLDRAQRIANIPTADTEGTLLERVLAYVNKVPRTVEAREIAQALGITLDGTRTVLSKLKARGEIARFEPGVYSSLRHANTIRGEPETR